MTEQKDHTIYLIEDSEILSHFITEYLKYDFEIIAFDSAEAAFQKCIIKKPDLILLDIILSGLMNGFDLLKNLKAEKQFSNIPVIIMSSLNSNDDILKGLSLGAIDYLLKPLDFNQLILKIKNTLNFQYQIKNKTLSDRIIESLPEEVTGNNWVQDFDLLIDKALEDQSQLTIKEICKSLNVSQSKLERLVKKRFNQTPNQFILQKKLENADLLLKTQSNFSVKEISYLSGFNSVSYFIRCYKNLYKRTPKVRLSMNN